MKSAATPHTRLHPLTRIAALALAAGLAASAHAQVQWRVEGSPATPRTPATSADAPRARVAVRSSSNTEHSNAAVRTIIHDNDDRTILASGTANNGDAYEIKVKNDNVEAKLNGKRVPDDRIRMADDRVEILGGDGEVIVTLSVDDAPTGAWMTPHPPHAPVPGQTQTWSTTPGLAITRSGTWSSDPGSITTAIAAQPAEPPKVMVGINMSDVDATLREHFGLDEDAGFVVDNVVEGLPADKAGIRQRDIVVSIDGSNVTSSSLRDLLKSKEPGQRVKVRILRKGENKDLDMTLEAYDASKLGIVAAAPGLNFLHDVPIQSFTFDQQLGEEESEEIARAMEEAQRAMEGAMSQMQGQLHGDNADSMLRAREQMNKALEEYRRARQSPRSTLGTTDTLGRYYVVPSPSAPSVPAIPGQPTPPAQRRFQVLREPAPGNPQGAERMAQLESRLDELNGRLDRLDDRIGRLLDRLERDN